MSLIDIIDFVQDEATARQFLQEHRILRFEPPKCDICGQLMTEIDKNDQTDKKVYHCSSHKNKEASLRVDSFLENHVTSFCDFILLVNLWSHEISMKQISKLLGFSENATSNWFSNIRDVCSQYLVDHPYQIGGKRHRVVIDECLLTESETKYIPFDAANPEKWLVGGVDTSTNIGFLQVVPTEERSMSILKPMLDKYILPGTRLSFVYDDDPDRVRVSPVQKWWWEARDKMELIYGEEIYSEIDPSYLDEILWRQIRGQEFAFDNILDDIANWYQVP